MFFKNAGLKRSKKMNPKKFFQTTKAKKGEFRALCDGAVESGVIELKVIRKKKKGGKYYSGPKGKYYRIKEEEKEEEEEEKEEEDHTQYSA